MRYKIRKFKNIAGNGTCTAVAIILSNTDNIELARHSFECSYPDDPLTSEMICSEEATQWADEFINSHLEL